MKVTRSQAFLFVSLLLWDHASASIRGAVRKMQRFVVNHNAFEGVHPKKNLIVTNKCPYPVQSILRFYDGTLKHIVMDISFQEAVATMTDNAVTVALVAGVQTDRDVYLNQCSSNDAKYVKKDGLCYKYHFFNSSSPYHIDITCE